MFWSFVNPLLLTVIYTVVFSIYLRIEMRGYPAFLLAGLLPWNCFVGGLNEGTQSIIAGAGIIKRVYLPSEVFPLVPILANAVHFLLSVPVLAGLVLWTGIPITWAWAVFPVVLVFQVVLTYGVVLVTSALAVEYRDILHILPNVVMLGFFLTPVFYPPETVPERFRFLLTGNPLSYVIEAYHSIFYSGQAPSLSDLGRIALLSVVAVLFGLWVFNKRREHFAEHI